MTTKNSFPKLSIIAPAFNEAQNLAHFHEQLTKAMQGKGLEWEILFIDDHSSDGTYEVIRALAAKDARVQGYRLSKNFGAHTAVRCGLERAKGDCALITAVDLQDPPEKIDELTAAWKEGHQIVWAVREKRHEESPLTLLFSRFYYWVMYHLLGIKALPLQGTGFYLMDRVVMDAYLQMSGKNVNTIAVLSWIGFRQKTISYESQPRLHGKSGWSFGKKLKLFIDSITSFSYLPLRFISLIGVVASVLGFIYAIMVVFNHLLGNPTEGWSSLMVVVLILGGLQMLMLGVIGEYLWRALDEARQRPAYFLEESTDAASR